MREETTHWGIDIVRTELKEIDPPKDVQETMNRVVKAENEKVAAVDFATATETMADGARRAEIKKAEGVKQAKILEAEGEARAIQLVNEAADKYFVGNAQLLRKLIAVETSLSNNAKIVVPSNTDLVNIIGDMAGLLPLVRSNGDAHKPQRLPPPGIESHPIFGAQHPETGPAANR
jgi:regulator of protease activity HflC (stomatin/prohibitin superfamily)